jgi:Rho GDP-dissociation inhibitor
VDSSDSSSDTITRTCGLFSFPKRSNRKTADAGDESLQRYKQSLGLGGGVDLSDPSDPRVCIIQALTMEAPDRQPVTIDLSTPGSEATLKDKPFKIKEGAKFTMVATFRVQHEILSGLHYVQAVKRKGIRVSKDSEMIVSTTHSCCFPLANSL